MLRDLYGTEADELLHDTVPEEPLPAEGTPAPAMVRMDLATA